MPDAPIADSNAPRPEKARRPSPLRGYVLNILIVAACTAVCFAISPHLDLVNFIMVYVLGTVSIASFCSLPSALLACLLSVLAFDYFFVPPRFGMSVNDAEHLLTMAMMFVVVLVVSRLTEHFRTQARNAGAREAQTKLMLELTRELAGARGADRLLGIATAQIARLYGLAAAAFLLDDSGQVVKRTGSEEALRDLPDADAACRWVVANMHPAGAGTSILPDSHALWVPMSGLGGPLGVLGVRPPKGQKGFPPERINMIETLARQVGLMLEVERLESARVSARMEIEAERLKTSLLSSVTHDLQTPLAVIIGSAESLAAVGEEMPPAERRELAENIQDRATRLSRLLGNLLRMSKLQSGTLKADLQLQPIDEPLGTALPLLSKAMADRPLELEIPEDLPLLRMDGALMEQLILNLLENIIKYTPADSPVRIAARRVGQSVELAVADRGPGLGGEDLEKMFDLFYQGGAASGQTGERKGYGVGLTICRAIAQVHGGEIRAENREGGGTVLTVSLPVPSEELSINVVGADSAEEVQ
jgi:two-component system sensor histidine kinase KdpD